VGFWVGFSVLQYTILCCNYINACEGDTGRISHSSLQQHYDVSYKALYWLIIVRDFACLSVMVIFQCRADRSQLYFSRLLDLDDKDSARVALQDFEMLLVSVVPHKAFSRFLTVEHPEMIPYLQMVHLCKLY